MPPTSATTGRPRRLPHERRPGLAQPVSLGEATRVFARIGLLSFGGPAGQIALMHRVLVDEKRWLDEARFLHALNYCMLLPGPEAMQLATYAGWLLHGVRGGLIAGLLFVLPGAVVITALSAIYLLRRRRAAGAGPAVRAEGGRACRRAGGADQGLEAGAQGLADGRAGDRRLRRHRLPETAVSG